MADRERWRRVPGWPAYKVSSRGRVKSVPRRLANGRDHGGLPLKLRPDKDGYLYVRFSDGVRSQRFAVHRLVLLAFEGPCPEGMEVLHGPGGNQDDGVTNLRYGTHWRTNRKNGR